MILKSRANKFTVLTSLNLSESFLIEIEILPAINVTVYTLYRLSLLVYIISQYFALF